MGNHLSDAELSELVMAHLAGEQSPSQQMQLESLLASDDASVQRYIQYVRESAILSTELSGVDRSFADHLAEKARIAERRLPENNERRHFAAECAATPARPLFHVPRTWWAVATAATIVVAVVATQNRNDHHDDRGVADGVQGNQVAVSENADRVDPNVVARVVRKVDCVWDDEKWTVESNSALRRGQMIRVSHGMMEIEFECGARVALQGPARFTVAGPNNGLFHSGNLTAVVPERARGFAIKAPTTNIIDLGTSFSLNVEDDGATEVHVIDGEVISQSLDRSGAPRGSETRLRERSALLVSLDGEESIDFKDSPRFLPGHDLQDSSSAGLDAVVADQLVLWLAADYDVERDDQGRVRRWGDRLYGGNTTAEMAWQFEQDKRPLWLSDAVGGRPALRFDGKSDFLVTDSLVTTDEQTVIMVVSPRPWTVPDSYTHVSRQILNYNGPPNIALQFIDETRFSCWNFAPTEAEMLKHDGEFATEPLHPNEPLVICYLYSLKGGFAELIVNGKRAGRIPVGSPAAIDSPKYIGCHWSEGQHLDGDLAELLIFNEALTPEATAEAVSYLAEKFGIPMEPTD